MVRRSNGEPRRNLFQVREGGCTHSDRKQAHRIRIGDWRPSNRPIRFARTTVSLSAHWPQNRHSRSMIEQKPSIERVVIESSNQRLSLTSPCERAATISFTPSAEFSDTKVLNVMTRSCAKHLEHWTCGVRDPFGPVLEKQVRTREFTGGKASGFDRYEGSMPICHACSGYIK
jgi:hypothetical protein